MGEHYEHMDMEIKRAIVRRYACYESNAEIRQAIKEEFGLELNSGQVGRYNPEAVSFDGGEALLELYTTTRRAFIEAMDNIAITHRAYRLQKLDQMERAVRMKGDFEQAAKLLRQAAEEMGGIYEKNKGGLDLITLQKEMDRWASAVVKHVKDPEALQAIEAELGASQEDPRRGLKAV